MVAMSKAGEWQGRISGYIRKLGRWKYPVLVLLLGVILLLLPQKQERTEPKNSTEPQEVFSGMDVQEQELETLLSQIDGAVCPPPRISAWTKQGRRLVTRRIPGSRPTGRKEAALRNRWSCIPQAAGPRARWSGRGQRHPTGEPSFSVRVPMTRLSDTA